MHECTRTARHELRALAHSGVAGVHSGCAVVHSRISMAVQRAEPAFSWYKSLFRL